MCLVLLRSAIDTQCASVCSGCGFEPLISTPVGMQCICGFETLISTPVVMRILHLIPVHMQLSERSAVVLTEQWQSLVYMQCITCTRVLAFLHWEYPIYWPNYPAEITRYKFGYNPQNTNAYPWYSAEEAFFAIVTGEQRRDLITIALHF